MNSNDTVEIIAVDVKGLMKMLSCGMPTAKEIGTLAGARLNISGNRHLYSVKKIKDYVNSNSK